MNPVALSVDVKARLVEVHNRGLYEGLLEVAVELGQAFGTTLAHVTDRPYTEPMSKQVLNQLPRPLQRNQLVVQKVVDHSTQPWAVLHHVAELGWKLCAAWLTTVRAPLRLGTIFGDFESHWRQLKHLASYFTRTRSIDQRLPTVKAGSGCQTIHFIGRLTHRQVVTGVAPLTARRSLTLGTIRAMACSVAGRGLAAVAAVCSQLLFQLLDSRLQSAKLLAQLLHQIAYGLWPTFVDDYDLFSSQGNAAVQSTDGLL